MNLVIVLTSAFLPLVVAQVGPPRPPAFPGTSPFFNGLTNAQNVPAGVDPSNPESVIRFVRSTMCQHTSQLKNLCLTDVTPQPTSCQCANGGAISFAGLNLNNVTPQLAMQLWDCKPSTCQCASGAVAPVSRPNIAGNVLPRNIIQRIVQAAFGSRSSCP